MDELDNSEDLETLPGRSGTPSLILHAAERSIIRFQGEGGSEDRLSRRDMTSRWLRHTRLVDHLDQLFARSVQDVEAHAGSLGNTDAGRQLLRESAALLASLRLWAQEQYRSDRVVRDLLENCDVQVLSAVAEELQASHEPEAGVAARSIISIAAKSPHELMVVASCALRAI